MFFPQSSAKGVRRLMFSAMVAAMVAPASIGSAQTNPFSGLEGSWTGEGTLTASDGHTERLRCRAKYYVSPSGLNLDQQLRCASDSYRFDVNSGLVRDASGGISGTWTETSRNATGSVRARPEGDAIVARVVGSSFTANMTVSTRGDSQSVEIVPTGADIKSVTIDMHRDG
jgi:hypothetical protein